MTESWKGRLLSRCIVIRVVSLMRSAYSWSSLDFRYHSFQFWRQSPGHGRCDFGVSNGITLQSFT